MTEHKLDAAALAEIAEEVAPYIALWEETSGAHDPNASLVVWTKRIAVLLAHIAAQDAEIAALRRVAEAARAVVDKSGTGEYSGESIVLDEQMNPLRSALDALAQETTDE
jgi:hypothetical protein